jgi:ABC-2 type transport system ATP-binding protein
MRAGVAAIELDGLTKVYPTGHRALDGLSLQVPPGTLFGFIGLNGSGKTTTIRAMAGLLGLDAGSIRLFGRDTSAADESWKRDVGFVLDEPLYFPWMTAKRYLRFVGSMYELPGRDVVARTDELIEFFDLHDKANDLIETLSTGMKKKISLAAAIIHGPQCVVLDEPLEGIDALAAASIKETLTLMVAKGATVFITSHVLDTVERLCTEVAIIDRGTILLQGATGDILRNAKGSAADGTAGSLEELLVDLVSDRLRKKHLSFL